MPVYSLPGALGLFWQTEIKQSTGLGPLVGYSALSSITLVNSQQRHSKTKLAVSRLPPLLIGLMYMYIRFFLSSEAENAAAYLERRDNARQFKQGDDPSRRLQDPQRNKGDVTIKLFMSSSLFSSAARHQRYLKLNKLSCR